MAVGSERIALIDADVVAYHAAFSAETPLNWGSGLWTLHAWEDDVRARVIDEIELIIERCEASDVVLALSHGKNWRKDVLPDYKANRSNQRKPMLLKFARQFLKSNYPTEVWPNLEADDLLGILATSPDYYRDENPIIVSIDKDLSQIPGRHLRYDKENDQDWIEEITEEQGDRLHMIQTLSGDPVDNYSGCPGIGDTKAQQIVDNPTRIEPVTETIKSGKNKGQERTRWKETGPAESVWEAVLCRFRKAGLTEDEALQQARVAKILRAEDYDMDKGEVILWNAK